MGAITYRETRIGSIKVFVDGTYTGSIVRNGTYWHYKPKGTSVPGTSYTTVEAVKRSLET